MNYILLGALLLGLLILGLWLRHYYLKSNYDKYIDLTASLLLAKGRYYRSRLHGSIIFELKQCSEELTDVQITNIKPTSSEILVKDFERIYFERNKKGQQDSTLSSASILITERAAQRYRQAGATIYIAGTLRFADRTKKSFAKKMDIHMINRE